MSSDKIIDLTAAELLVNQWKVAGNKVVFTNGCFDILHVGHVDYLEKARLLGDRLIVGLNTDRSICSIKGKQRPIVEQSARSRVLAALQFVDAVILFDEDTPIRLIQTVKPDILVKGNDYTTSMIIGADFVVEQGGKVQTIPLVPGFSTSRIIERIKNVT